MACLTGPQDGEPLEYMAESHVSQVENHSPHSGRSENQSASERPMILPEMSKLQRGIHPAGPPTRHNAFEKLHLPE
jgi:hypothetical protein